MSWISGNDAKHHSEQEDSQMKRAYEEKERAQKLEEENEILKSQPESQRNLTVKTWQEQELAKLREELREKEEILQQSNLRALNMEISYDQKITRLQEELRQLNLRHASISERRVRSDGRRTENTLSTNRQSELEQEYITDLKDGFRCDAIEVIMLDAQKRNTKSDEKATMKAYRLTCFIFEVACDIATRVHNNFKAVSSCALETLVNETPAIGIKCSLPQTLMPSQSSRQVQDAMTEVLVLVKETATNHNLDMLYKVVKNTVAENWNKRRDKWLPSSDPHLFRDLEIYIEHCTRFAWRMVTQLPPLRIDCSSQTYNPEEHIKSQAFSSSTKQLTSKKSTSPCEKEEIKCYSWPTLRDWDDRVIQKGEVIL